MFNSERIFGWLEHALIVAGIAGLTDLAANVSGVFSDQFILILVGAVVGAALRFVNKLGDVAGG